MIKILIADDHPVVREGLKQVIAKTSDLAVAGEATDGQEVLDKLRVEPWDMVLLDITMPGKNGIEILMEIKKEYPRLPVLMLSVHPEEQYAVWSLKAGASGYITKSSAPEQLIVAIRKIMAGGRYVSPSFAEHLLSYLDPKSEKPPHEQLSEREFQVLCRLASGRTVKDIAQELSLSVQTISTYRARVLTKLNMKSNAELAHYAIRNNLVD